MTASEAVKRLERALGWNPAWREKECEPYADGDTLGYRINAAKRAATHALRIGVCGATRFKKLVDAFYALEEATKASTP